MENMFQEEINKPKERGKKFMRNFPKNLKTKEDIYNCLEMVRAGELRVADLVKAINKIKNQNYINAPIKELSEDRKTITTHYLAEAAAGGKAIVGTASVTIKGVTHVDSDPDEQGNTTKIASEIVISKAATKGAEMFALEKNPSVYDKYGVTEAELNDILAELEG